MSTISASVSRRIRSPRSAGTAAMAEVSAAASSRSASAGGVQGTCGAGDGAGHARDARRADAAAEERAPGQERARWNRCGSPLASAVRDGRRPPAPVLPPLERLADGVHHVGVGRLVAPEPGADPLAPDGQRAPRVADGLR